MKRFIGLILAGTILLVSPATLAKSKIYICPMHPSYRAEKPGKCPICGMDLVPLKTEEPLKTPPPAHEKKNHLTPKKSALPLAPVKLSPERAQLIGVKLARVTHEKVVISLRAPARVKYDETRLFTVHTRVAGWVEEVRADYTGKFVKRGEVLFTLYAPEVLSTQEELIRGLRWLKKLQEMKASPKLISEAENLIQSARRRLALWNFPEEALREVEHTLKPLKAFPVVSPVSGWVVAKQVFPGKRIAPETPLYTLADVSKVFIEADFYETELPEIRPGLKVEVVFPYLNRTFRGKIEEVYPYMEAKLRVLRARLTLDNPEGLLRPGMWAEVRTEIPLGMRMVIPDEALIYGGGHYYVFIKKGDGLFEPRMVRVGRKVGDKRIVLSGVSHGEEVVVSANFLIDAESRLKAALSAFGGGHDHAHH
ncbi:efflux RND transporter periplasmic adaptor subunit [Thermosulfurimonas dismutans]|uniref:Putative Co/Zn/Cd efflux system membrane fusion protein n=1 Tax=Thermosulfurimonas dismutans TaxID=999894 RepID=A0A179D395_9BACT|nr:efflux RND transporter periplasmic adaptor subunit [Thermosulfurimonas dismutans]OAQ20516.1 putative Co/Zn/Cd efflux system membrane fusion protein [Thermosulfurimonas dismutans]